MMPPLVALHLLILLEDLDDVSTVLTAVDSMDLWLEWRTRMVLPFRRSDPPSNNGVGWMWNADAVQ